jgi:peptide/nickel transport system substrate-binding protein
VRQAIAHIVDPAPITENSGSYRIPITDDAYAGAHIITGLSPNEFQKIRDVAEESFIDYSSEERAAELLEEAGFSQEDGTWIKPDGSPFEPTGISDSGHPDWVAVGETVASQLQDFGIQAEQQPLESTQFENRFSGGDFEMVFGAETAREGRFPGAYFDYELNWRTFGTPVGGGDPTATLYPANDPVQIPPVGEPDAEPSVEVIPNELLNQLLRATDEEEIRDLTIQAAWLQNYDVQMIDLMDASQHAAITRDDWIWPPTDFMWGDQRAAQNIVYHSVRGGEVQAKTQD